MGNFISNFFKNDEVKIKEDTVIDEDVIPLMIQANINTNISEESPSVWYPESHQLGILPLTPLVLLYC